MADNLVQMAFSLAWNSQFVSHMDRSFFPKINFWRDIFPDQVELQLNKLQKEGHLDLELKAGSLVEPFVQSKSIHISNGRINYKQRALENIQFGQGRFYPRGLLSDIGIPPQDHRPCRIIKNDGQDLQIDLNHPLSQYPISLNAEIVDYLSEEHKRGGSSIDIGCELTENGPGLQGHLADITTEFFNTDPFARVDTQPDPQFYQHPRLVNHVDEVASQHFAEIYGRFLKPGMKILDLMAAWNSHINLGKSELHVTGLGLNQEEQEKNPVLSDVVVQDLNQKPGLSFENETFDACICTVSIEYLIDPDAVFKEVGRVLKKGAPFIITFSDRWFDTKVTKLWTELHPFERMGLVTTYFQKSEIFTELNTESIRGYPRLENDAHFPDRKESDPVFAVWGYRS